MFITKKKHAAIVAGLNAEIVRLGTLLTDQREVKDLMHSSTARTDRLLERLVDKAASFSTFTAGPLNIRGELNMPDNVPVYVDEVSTPINDGGTAFSVPDSHLTTGMSLRAYIAAKALPTLIGLTTPADAAKYTPDDLQAAAARAACGYANKLIAELGKGGK